ncbi:MAG: hypothetical protein JXR96_29635 [Deltaproteobacteria bacterium]|nr:hypothetical protein [Deltaproteobacteria bacterium]
MSGSTRLGSVLMCGFLLASPSSAWAELGDISLNFGPLFGTEFDSQRKDGLGAQLTFDVGLSEFFSFTAGAGYVRHFIGGGEAYQLIHAGAGLVYKLDILIVVPFLSVRLGFLHLAFDEQSRSGVGFSAAIGVDYLWSESFSAGLSLGYHGMLSDLEGFPSYLAVDARFGFLLPY